MKLSQQIRLHVFFLRHNVDWQLRVMTIIVVGTTQDAACIDEEFFDISDERVSDSIHDVERIAVATTVIL